MPVQGELIEYTFEGDTYEGYVAYDSDLEVTRPGVLVSHAWGGRGDFENARADDLAALGYTAFALDVYGQGIRGKSREENRALMTPLMEDRALLQRRLIKSLTTMRAHPTVDQARTAIIGYCFGGLCAIDLARAGSNILGAVSIHGLLQGIDNDDAPKPISASVLALHGWDDPMATPDTVLVFADEMKTRQADWQLHAYGNTVHAFTNPQAQDPEFGTVYSALADQRSWLAITDFLSEVLAESGQ